MGCGGSKKAKFKATASHVSSQPGPYSGEATTTTTAAEDAEDATCPPIPAVEVNVFDDTTSNNNNRLGGSCYNAKPRLLSAIRRGDSALIKPVTSDESDHAHSGQNGQSGAVPYSPSSLSPIPSPSPLLPPSPLPPPPPYPQSADTPTHLLLLTTTTTPTPRANSQTPDYVTTTSGGRREDVVHQASGRVSHASLVSGRPDSEMTGSVVTARDLNASFLTVSEDFLTAPPTNGHGELLGGFQTDTPLGDLADFEDPQSRTPSATPSRSVMSAEPPTPVPVVAFPTSIAVIREESEGGFTPRSVGALNFDDSNPLAPISDRETWTTTTTNPPPPPTKELPKYPPDEVLFRNQTSGWCEWGIYKGRVYDTSKVIHALSPVYSQRMAMEKARQKIQREHERSERRLHSRDGDDRDDSDGSGDSDDDEDDYEGGAIVKTFASVYPRRDINPTGSLGRAVRMLLDCGLDLTSILERLAQCVVGEVEHVFSRRFWNAFRKDVEKVLEDFIRADLQDEISPNVRDVMHQLQRWVRKYRDHDPPTPAPQSGDPNRKHFLLPDGIQTHPEVLRQWVDTWEQFDLDIPESGAWPVYEIEDAEPIDAHEVFLATLRSHFDLDNPLTLTFEGEAAWDVLQPGVIAGDVMTEGQRVTEATRRLRTDLHNPRRMKRRRHRLMLYFIRAYEMDERYARSFLQWSQSMEEGERRFQLLCRDST